MVKLKSFCKGNYQFSSVQLLSHVRLFAIPWIEACQASLSITNSRSSPKLISIESVMPSSHLILCCPLFLLPPIPPSIRVFSSELTLLMRWPKYWSFSFSISPSNEHPGLISFRMDWLDLLAVQGTLKQSEKTTLRIGENKSKWNNWQRINFQNIQATHTSKYQKKTNNLNSGRKGLNRHFSKEDIQMANMEKMLNIAHY